MTLAKNTAERREEVNGDLRDHHCQGFLCNGVSVRDRGNVPGTPCECSCADCMRAKGRGEGLIDAFKERNRKRRSSRAAV